MTRRAKAIVNFSHLINSRVGGSQLLNIQVFVQRSQTIMVVILVGVFMKYSTVAAEPQIVLLLELWQEKFLCALDELNKEKKEMKVEV